MGLCACVKRCNMPGQSEVKEDVVKQFRWETWVHFCELFGWNEKIRRSNALLDALLVFCVSKSIMSDNKYPYPPEAEGRMSKYYGEI